MSDKQIYDTISGLMDDRRELRRELEGVKLHNFALWAFCLLGWTMAAVMAGMLYLWG